MGRVLAILGSVLGLAGVGLGAFGAHALRNRLSAESLAIFETAVRYQMYHALALLAAAWASERWPAGPLVWAGWLFAAGVVVFSGSLYLMTLTGQRCWGAVTPLGGLALLGGWAAMIWGFWTRT